MQVNVFNILSNYLSILFSPLNNSLTIVSERNVLGVILNYPGTREYSLSSF